MSRLSTTTGWSRTYTRDKVEYRPEGGWDGTAACTSTALNRHRLGTVYWARHKFCYERTYSCRAVSQPAAPTTKFEPASNYNFTDSTKTSSPVCPYVSPYNTGTAAQRMINCPGDGTASGAPTDWADGTPGSWQDSAKKTSQKWKFVGTYRYCGPIGQGPQLYNGTQLMTMDAVTVSVDHPLEEKRTPQTKLENRTESCDVECYP
jgi:hypothetical protein